MRIVITTIAGVFAIVHMLWPDVGIDNITVALLVVAVIPWLGTLFRSLELPGGVKIEYQQLREVTERAEEAGLLEPEPVGTLWFPTWARVVDEDPNLALAGLRIEIERQLQRLAQAKSINHDGASAGQLVRSLAKHEVLSSEESGALIDLLTLLNRAVHGAEVDPLAVEWAVSTGSRLLSGLKRRETEK